MPLFDGNEPMRFRIWQRPQQHPFDDGENGGVGADAKRQRGQRRDCESGMLAERARRVDDVLAELIDQRAGARVAHLFLDLLDASQRQQRAAPCLRGVLSCLAPFVGNQIDV